MRTGKLYAVDQVILVQNLFNGSEAKDVGVEDMNSFIIQRIQRDRDATLTPNEQKQSLKATELGNFRKLNFTPTGEREDPRRSKAMNTELGSTG